MTCDQAISYFAKNGVIYKNVGGAPLPLRRGVPVSQSNRVHCGFDGFKWHTQVATIDNKR